MLVKTVNTISYFICKLILLVTGAEIKIDPSIFAYRKKSDEGLIMISNHQSIFDPWLICASLPIKTFFNIMPVRIMGALDFADPVANFLHKLGVVKLTYYLYGVLGFRREWSFEEKLAPFVTCLKQGGTILIFPEGYLNRENKVDTFKRGIIHIYHSIPSDILPFAINRKNKTKIGIGPITRIPETITESEDPSDQFSSRSCEYLRQQVANLYA